MAKLALSIAPAAKNVVTYADLGSSTRIARIEFRRSVKFRKRALPFTSAAVNCPVQDSRIGVVRLEFHDSVELSQRRIIVAMAPVIKQRQGQMCIRQSRSER